MSTNYSSSKMFDEISSSSKISAHTDLASLDIEQLAQLLAQADASKQTEREGLKEISDITSFDPSEKGLSLAQERLWFMDRLSPHNPFYNIPFAFRLKGSINITALQQAWKDTVERHETLRLCIRSSEKGEPLTSYHPINLFTLIEKGDATPFRITQAMRNEAETGFDLERDPLIRGSLFAEADGNYILLFTAHHIIFDGWSIGIFLRDLTHAYKARQFGTCPEWAPLPATYTQYAAWHRQKVRSTEKQQILWWRERLANLPDLEPPTDFPRPAVQSFKGDVLSFSIPQKIMSGIEAIAAEENATPYAVWLTLFALAISRFTAQNDFAIGSSFAGRMHPATEPLVGFFVENLSIRIRINPQASLHNLLQSVRNEALETLEHAELPFQILTDALGRQRDLSRNPIYQAAFTYQNMLSDIPQTEDIMFEPLPVPALSTHMDLELLAWPGEHSMECRLLYSTDLFKPETIHHFSVLFTELARYAAANPQSLEVPVTRFGLDTAPSIARGSIRAHSFTAPWKMFDGLCTTVPSATAVIAVPKPGTHGEERRFSRFELLQMAEHLASHMAYRGVGPGSVVLLCQEQGVELLASMLAVWRLGATWTTLAVRHPASFANWIVTDSKAACILTEPDIWKGDSTLTLHVSHLLTLPALPLGSPHSPQPNDTACILYTSGSSGRPKGVLLSHAALSNRLHWMWEQFPWGENEICCQKTSPVFVDFLWEAFGPLLCGIPLVTIPGGGAADIPWLLEILERYKVTRLVLVPSLLAEMHRLPSKLTGRLTTLRILTASGEPLPPDLAAATIKNLPSIRLLNFYGSTEVMGDATFYEVTKEEIGSVPIGEPIHNTVVAILDEQGSVLPRGAVGKLYVAGICLASGYYGAAKNLDSAWLNESHHAGMSDAVYKELVTLGGQQVWFCTGDLARIDEFGIIHYCGRGDRQVKIRGVRIEPEEIQTVLEAHPLVHEARVLAVTARSGKESEPAHSEPRLVAYVVPDIVKKTAEKTTDSRERCLEQWKTLYDSMYSSVRRDGDILNNFLIWESSYTGQHIPSEEMREWLSESLASIHALSPKSVLEIGCGQGFLLMDLVRTCERYVGLDISSQALACLEDILHSKTSSNIKAQLTLVQGEATALSHLQKVGELPFDTAIFNSVVQYFPDYTYCIEAINQAIQRTEVGGKIYIGDIRNFSGLDLFHIAVQLHRNPDDITAQNLLDMANARKRMESELLLSPAFWHALPSLIPRISYVETRPKRGHSNNELTEFRYEVVLYCDHHPFRPFVGTTLSWGNHGSSSRSELIAALANFAPAAFNSGEALGISGIPHARLALYQSVRQLAEESCLAGTKQTLGELRHQAQKFVDASEVIHGLTPEDLHELATKQGLEVALTFDLRDGISFNALFYAPGNNIPSIDVPWPAPHEGTSLPSACLANAPAASRDETSLRSDLRDYLADHLPQTMLPDVILTVPEWPRTPSGKIDWKRLPSPNTRLFSSTSGMQLPSTPEESRIADIWKLVIGIDEVSVHDNFFEIGGTSLLLTQVHQMIQHTLHRTFPLSVLFQFPTIHTLVAWLTTPKTTKEETIPADARIERLERRRSIRSGRKRN